MNMLWIDPGEFIMGSPESDVSRQLDEVPHVVALTKGFWLADTACSQASWEQVMENNPSRLKGAELPVTHVSWYDVMEFVEKLHAAPSALRYRLPTEAEWEYACRAGTQTPYSFGDVITKKQARYLSDGPVNVRSFQPNPWGFYQMHGNVWEWCSDWYGPYPEGPVTDPTGPDPSGGRVLRGGCWHNDSENTRSAIRDRCAPIGRVSFIGFRLAGDAERRVLRGGGWNSSLSKDTRSATRNHSSSDYCASYIGFRLAGDSKRVLRGGGWGSYGKHARSAQRYFDSPSTRYSYFGFRLAGDTK